jgi:hypothetical protein
MRSPPHGKVVRKIDDNRWSICWRGILMGAEQVDGKWFYRCYSRAFHQEVYGMTPRETAKSLSRAIDFGGGFRLVRWAGMYGYWYLYMESPCAIYGPLVMTWHRRPSRNEVVAAIALAKLERST